MSNYHEQAHEFEQRWQAYWRERQTYRTPNPGEAGFNPAKPKFFVLDMFPYPSGAGLHVGHPLGYIGTDVFARFLRMRGCNVLHSMGFDAFGLPAEQYAIQTGQHPRVTTEQNIATMNRQLAKIGLGHDPTRSFATTDPEYYRWTQWIFLQLYNSFYDPTCRWTGPDGAENIGRARPIHELEVLLRKGDWGLDESGQAVPGQGRPALSVGEVEFQAALDKARLAYLAEVAVNWCPQLGTVLANEEVTNEGLSERGNFPVFKRPLKQWVLRITAYADRLVKDLDDLSWPLSVVEMQKNWIGRSEGAEVVFTIAARESENQEGQAPHSEADQPEAVPGSPAQKITVFTTRPDTLFGATYMVLAPEHPLVDQITSAAQREAVQAYQKEAAAKTEIQRMEDAAAGKKSGVFTGAYAINPADGLEVPIWISDYVMMGYGTGAIMAVPAHDERDFAFAKTFNLPIRAVVLPDDEWLKTQAIEFSRLQVESDERILPACEGDQEKAEQVRQNTLRRFTEQIRSLNEGEMKQLRDEYAVKAAMFPTAFTGEGTGINSENDEVSLDGLATPTAKEKITAWLQTSGLGRPLTQYKLRDWLFSRQRYWGEPFPVVYDENGRCWPLDESELPARLPEISDFSPRSSDDPQSLPEPPLARAGEWVNVRGYVTDAGTVKLEKTSDQTAPANKDSAELQNSELRIQNFRRDVNTMPNWAGSCWYYLRYCDPRNRERFVGAEAERYWMAGVTGPEGKSRDDLAVSPSFSVGTIKSHAGGVDLYVGGTEHAVLHLLYSRFWHKVLYDLGQVSTREPFQRLFNQGMITADAFTDSRGVYVDVRKVEFRLEDGKDIPYHQETGERLNREPGKMGKSLKNAISPDEVVEEYSVDVFRLYEMYMGPLDASKPWNTRDIIGMQRFCNAVWRLAENAPASADTPVPDQPVNDELDRLTHKTIRRVTEDITHLKMNTAIAALIELTNALSKSLTSPDRKGGVQENADTPSRSNVESGGEAGINEPKTASAAINLQHLRALMLMLAPFAPHLAEELFSRIEPQEHQRLGSVVYAPWPTYDPAKCVDAHLEVPVTVNGKLRGKVQVAADADDAAIRTVALADEAVQKSLAGRTPFKIIIARKGATPLVNLVVK